MREEKNPFYIGNNRVMISLGPLTDKRYCPYDCAFCYVKSGFMKYTPMEIEDIIKFLIKNRQKYNIVYISGDTDSFAPPRTERAIKLIKNIAKELDTDILFTTRAIFNKEQLEKLKNINDYMKNKSTKLIACISISRLYSANYIEPYPIPSPEERINAIKQLKENGLYTILATRPFLPIINANEYIEIIERCKQYIDAVLGEIWYADEELIKNVCKEIDVNKIDFVEKLMDFDDNDIIWKCYEAKDTIKFVKRYCKDNGIQFFMRSQPAVEFIRNKNNNYKICKGDKTYVQNRNTR